MHISAIPFITSAILLSLSYYYKYRKLRVVGYILLFLGFILYISAFLLDDFTLKEVYDHSSKHLSIIYKLCASWSGSCGFILWWCFALALLSLLYGTRYHDLVVLFLLIILTLNGAFETLNFKPINGLGLNPLLKTFWMLLHPPATFIGYALGMFVAVDSIVNRENRFLIYLAWIFITIANILGALWSYFTLGWGGYWAWDPVETSLLLPWLSLTAYFHNRNRGLLSLTGFSVTFAAYITRGGISILHGFAYSSFGFTILLLGLPFLLKSIKPLRDLKLCFNPLNIATLSIVFMYLVCLIGLMYQLLGFRVGTDYFNFTNAPFLATLLLILPICKASYKNYLKIVFAVLVISSICSALTLLNYLKICEDAPTHVNVAGAFIIPIAIFSLFGSIFSFDRIDYKLIHLSIPLIVIATAISWPYAYYGNYHSIYLSEKEIHVDGMNIKLKSIDFKESKGYLSVHGYEIPEESIEVVYFEVNGINLSARIKLNLLWLLSGRSFLFPEPCVVNSKLDNYYFVIPDIHAYDLFMFTSKRLYEQNETLLLMSIAKLMNTSYDTFIKNLNNWKLSNGVLLMYKRIPLVNLVWISSILLVLGEVLCLMRCRK